MSAFATPGVTFGVDTSQNYQVWGNVEPVTLYAPVKSGAAPSFPIPIAKRRNPTYRERLPTGGVYGAALLTWLLPAALVTAAGATGVNAPQQGWTVLDGAGVTWTVLEASHNALRSTWLCVSLNLRLVFQLQDTLTVKRPHGVATDAASGRVYPSYDTIYTGVPCRFQLQEARVQDERGKRLTVSRYVVPVMYLVNNVVTPLTLTAEDQIIRDGDGAVFEFTRLYDRDRIDELQKIECEQRGWSP